MKRPLVFASLCALACSAMSQKGLTAKEIYTKCRGSVVKIETKFRANGKWMVGVGTGFFFKSDDLVVTAYHLVRDVESLTVTDFGGKRFTIKHIGIDPTSDVALLRLAQHSRRQPLGSKPFASISVGDPVYVIGNSLGVLGNTLSQGIVSGKRKSGGHPLVQSTAPISQGNSGGPLLDEQGNVIGVVSFYLRNGQNLNMAVAMNEVQRTSIDKDAWFVASVYFANPSWRVAYSNNDKTSTPEVQKPPSTEESNQGEIKVSTRPGSGFMPTLLAEGPPLGDVLYNQIAISPEGRYAGLSSKNTLCVLDVERRTSQIVTIDSDICQIAFAGEDRIVISRTDGDIELRACDSIAVKARYATKNAYSGVKIDVLGMKFYVARPRTQEGELVKLDWTLDVLDLGDKKIRAVKDKFPNLGDFDLAQDSTMIVGVVEGGGSAESPDVLQVLRLSDRSTVDLKNVVTSEVFEDTAGVKVYSTWIMYPLFSPDGQTVAALTVKSGDRPHESTIETFSSSSGLPKRTYSLGEKSISSMSFLSDGQHLVVVRNYEIECLNLISGATEFTLRDRHSSYKAVCANKAPVLVIYNGKRIKVFRLK